MALMRCPECSKEISDQAAACPHCGYPVSGGSSSSAPRPRSAPGAPRWSERPLNDAGEALLRERYGHAVPGRVRRRTWRWIAQEDLLLIDDLPPQRPWDWRRIASAVDRTRRVEFWAAWALSYLIPVIGFVLGSAWMAVSGGMDNDSLSLLALIGFWIIFGTSFLASVWMGLGSAINRVHDTGRSPWILLLLLVPIAGTLVFLWMGVQEGQPEANRWGPPVGNL